MENRAGYKNTELGWIPESWEVVALKNCVSNFIVPMRDKPKIFDGDIPWCRIEDFNGKYLSGSKDGKCVSNDLINSMHLKVYPIGTVLCSCSANIGVCAITTNFLITNQTFIGLYPSDCLEKEFLYYLMSFNANNLQKISTGTTIAYLPREKFETYRIPLPPLPEQQKIASILTTVDDKISSIEAQIQQTEQLKKGLMAKLLTEGIGNTEFKDTEIGRIPKGWEVVTLQTLLDRKSILHHSDGNHGSLYPRSNEFITHGIPYIGANSIQNGRINLTKAKYLSEAMAATFKKGVAYNGDVLFASNATVGPVALLYLPYNYSILSTTLTLYRCDINQINNYYLFFYLSSALFTEQYLPLIKQTTRNQLPITAQRTLKIILPPFSEQQQIASILSSVDDKIDILQSKKSAYTTLKKGLMAKLLTGQIRVKI